MKKTPVFLLLLSFLTFQVVCAQSGPQVGALWGTVRDGGNQSPLPGVGIALLEEERTALSNPMGQFFLSQLPAGDYKVALSMPGYGIDTVAVKVLASDTSLLDIRLEEGHLELETVHIRSLANPDQNLFSQLDLALQPVSSGQELLQLTPGLEIAQHAGGGKAEQLFFRGFDLDHGTDLAIGVDGIPVNLVSHAHGQGYSDLHFLIPETVERVSLERGPHQVEAGNFATSGSLALKTRDRLNQSMVRTGYGAFGTSRTLAMINLTKRENANFHAYGAGEFLASRGYFDQPQDLKRVNLFLRMSGNAGPRTQFRGSLSAFQSSWQASGQIPERAVAQGMIGRLGAIDPTEGGKTARQQANFELLHTLPNRSVLKQQVYGVHSAFNLLSNFTFSLNYPSLGDRIVQNEDRYFWGYRGSWEHVTSHKKLSLQHRAGWGFRDDKVGDLALNWVDASGAVHERAQDGQVRETNAFAYFSETVDFHPHWSFEIGGRLDGFRFQYDNQLVENKPTLVATKGRISPKSQLNWTPVDQLQVYAKLGQGFHSNDSRSQLENVQVSLPGGWGTDLGLVWKPAPRLLVQAGIWQLDLEQELVYVGDEGVVEPGEASRRRGGDLSLRYQVKPGLMASVDVNYAHARYRNGDYVPLAPILSSRAGLYGEWTDRWSGGMGLRYLADRPADETGSLTATGFCLLEASVRCQVTSRWNVGLNGENLLNQAYNEAQFATTSQLMGEANPVTEIHFTPGAPRGLRAYLEVQF